MKIKKTIIGNFFISIFLTYAVYAVSTKSKPVIGVITPKTSLIITVCALFLASILLRLKRTQMLIHVIKTNSIATNMQASSVGYLANLVLPFRLGEFARGVFLSRKLGISLGFTLGTIALDRGLDLVLITLTLLAHYSLNSFENIKVFSQSELMVIVTGTIIFFVFLSVIARSKFLLAFISLTTEVFNLQVKSKLRNSFWRSILIFQRISQNRKFLRKYLLVVILSWVFTYAANFY